MRKWGRKCGGHSFVPCPFSAFLVMLLATGQWCRQLPIHSGGGDIPNCADHPATTKIYNENLLVRKWGGNCGGHGFVPCPFTALLVMLLATGQWWSWLPIHSGGGDIPNCADRPAMMKLKK